MTPSASALRLDIAQEVADRCPAALGQEILLAGSVARGRGDAYSDIEQVFYVASMPSRQSRDTWLTRLGAERILHDHDPLHDHSLWSTFRFRGVWIEAGWQVLSQHDDWLRQIVAGQILQHSLLLLAEMTNTARSLRTQGWLARWQGALAHYPQLLQTRLIQDALEPWRFPNLLAARWAAAAREDPLALTERLVRDVQGVLRILFALNLQWEPEWKGLKDRTTLLPVKPESFLERLAAIFSTDPSIARIASCFHLMQETLDLIPGTIDADQARLAVRQSLSQQGRDVWMSA
jgi:hypothetical protein